MDMPPNASSASSAVRFPIPPPLLLLANHHLNQGEEDAATLTALPMQSSNILLPNTQQNNLVARALHHQQISTPTMHPNLVTTLKSIISPPYHIPMQSSLDLIAADAFSIQVSPAAVDSEASFERLVEMQANEALGLCTFQEASCTSASDEGEVAVVPLDLIQNRRPFRCANPNCSKTFKNPQTLKMHLKTHYSLESKCALGSYSLTASPSAFKAGRSKKIPSRCPVCKRTFVGLYELRRHFGRKHSQGEKTYACEKCSKKFYIEVDLRDHQKLCGDPIKCKCGMKFAFRCNLVAHKKSRPECHDTVPTEEQQNSGTMASFSVRTLSNSKPGLSLEAFQYSSPFESPSTSVERI